MDEVLHICGCCSELLLVSVPEGAELVCGTHKLSIYDWGNVDGVDYCGDCLWMLKARGDIYEIGGKGLEICYE